MIHDKDYFFAKAKKNGNIDDWRIARNLRNQTKALIKNAKIDFIKEQLEENKSDSKRFWRNIKMLLSDMNKNNQIHLNDDTKTQVPDTEVSKYINEFFTPIGPKLAQKDISNYQFHGEHFPANLHLNQTDTAEVIKLAKEINISKSSAIGGISSRLLRDMILALPDQFTHIFNTSIEFNSFPDSWKIASVTPIPKEGNPLDVNNYRPISLIPLPGKLLEKLICNQIINYLDNNHILDANQSGCRAKHSINATVAKLTDDICINFNNNQPTIATYIDFKKAFDTINHQIFFKKTTLFRIPQGCHKMDRKLPAKQKTTYYS